ncbi:MAG: ATP-binding protein [Ancalomicrobiaceae bacterium]|nr:ATP-binding protein [Ancalomicrobiaceae bacterium]
MPGPHRSIDMAEILSILRVVAGQLEFRSVIQAASTAIRELIPHDHLDVALISPDRTEVTAYETGLHTEWDAATTATKPVDVSPIRDLFCGEVDHILTDDAQSDPRFHFTGAFSTPIFAAGLRSRLHVALKVEGRTIGALSFSTQQIGSYGPTEVDSARIVGDILSSYIYALQQSELAKRSELQQVEAEARAEGLRIGALHLTEELENARQAIGMDLHDQTLADLTRISRQLKRLTGRTLLHGAELQPLQEDIDHCLRELRVIIDSAKPSVLQFFGFGQAVEAFLERSAASTAGEITVRLVDDGTTGIDDLPQSTVVALYRIVQEAVNNALRHAEASRVEVRLSRESADGRTRIVVEDDGRGLPKAACRRTGGLSNMRTRASLIRADLLTGPGTDGVGTRLELILSEPPPARDIRRNSER